MIKICIGLECGDALHCNKRKICKYRAKWHKFHNLSCSIHRFFEYRLHIKLPHLISITQYWIRLSGTKLCPYGKSRDYGCYDCKYVSGEILRDCSCKERNETPYEKRLEGINTEWGTRCAYFRKCEWANDFKTDEYLENVTYKRIEKIKV